jgi:hypothetical protein
MSQDNADGVSAYPGNIGNTQSLLPASSNLLDTIATAGNGWGIVSKRALNPSQDVRRDVPVTMTDGNIRIGESSEAEAAASRSVPVPPSGTDLFGNTTSG